MLCTKEGPYVVSSISQDELLMILKVTIGVLG